jgi:hypothetical protein
MIKNASSTREDHCAHRTTSRCHFKTWQQAPPQSNLGAQTFTMLKELEIECAWSQIKMYDALDDIKPESL